MLNKNTDIRFLKGVGQKRAESFNGLGIDTVGALLRFYPRAYVDFGNITQIFELSVGEKVCVKARIITPVTEYVIRPKMALYKFTVTDGTGRMNVTIFNNKYLAMKLHEGSEYLFYGKVSGDYFGVEMSAPEIRETGAAGMCPVYPSGKGLTSKNIEKYVKEALFADMGEDTIPENVLKNNNLCDLETALQNIHFPKSTEACERAKRRLVFEELFVLQTGLMLLKGKKRRFAGLKITRNTKSDFENRLGFPLTSAQSRAIDDCLADMMSGKTMNRLIQGDVGSGKTAVAAALMVISADNGFQSALMAPTEILAEQHYATICELLKGSKTECVLLTGSMTKKQKDAAKSRLADGSCAIAVGTHALLSQDVSFARLGLVITDEQHRFGVGQRAALAAKGERPHTLVMSATPIPRTLALIIYGDLDISVINEYPKGRQKIESYCVTGAYRKRVYNYIKKHLDEGRQGYIVCPAVEESEDESLCSAEEYYKNIQQEKLFSGYRTGLLHGQMNAKDKDRTMREFKDGKIQLLVCTTVIEVGIDVPNAAIMVIENAERFGLSQLHQLRGRIGRGQYRSTCIFISDKSGDSTSERLKVITQNTDGFKIADEDLRLRGPGDFLGNRQHGLPQLRIADISADIDTLRLAGMEAANVLEHDPKLELPEHLPLRKEIIELYRKLNEN